MNTNLEFSEIIEAENKEFNILYVTCYNYPFKIPPIEDILNSLEIILKNNDFTFNSKAYRETTGAQWEALH